MRNTIELTPATLRVLKRACNKAVKEGRSEFTFEGNVILVAYAKYLIEYAQMQSKK